MPRSAEMPIHRANASEASPHAFQRALDGCGRLLRAKKFKSGAPKNEVATRASAPKLMTSLCSHTVSHYNRRAHMWGRG